MHSGVYQSLGLNVSHCVRLQDDGIGQQWQYKRKKSNTCFDVIWSVMYDSISNTTICCIFDTLLSCWCVVFVIIYLLALLYYFKSVHMSCSTTKLTKWNVGSAKRIRSAWAGHFNSIGSVSTWHAGGLEFDPHVRHILLIFVETW